jgi:peptidyl-prolyl cis-trans isomerase B (cyclophilin B)
MEVENYGTILLELDGKAAPVTVTNFVNLVNDKFYDGITFHRIMDGFMIQGGDPTGTGYNGSGTTITGEFAQNGYDNPISHTAGTISMARSNDPNSASSQFFICVADDQFLDGSYAAFGHVIEGMDVCLKIASDAKPVDDNGTIKPEEQPVIKYAKVVEH